MMAMRRTVRRVLLVLAASAAGTTPLAAQPEAAQTVQGLHATLLEIMRGEGMGFEARLARVEPVVRASFDFARIARTALGASWEGMDASERARMQSLLQRLSAVTYADRFDSYDGEAFELVEEQAGRRRQRVVRTVMVRGRERLAQLDYVLHETADGWRILNVVADGVSDLSLKRAEYASVIRKEGVTALLDKVERQVTDLATRAAAGG